MEAVFLTKYLLEMAQCDIIGFSGTQDFHNILDLHSLSNRLKNKASKSQLLTIEAKGTCTNHVDKRGGGGGAQMTTTLNNSYFVKVST